MNPEIGTYDKTYQSNPFANLNNFFQVLLRAESYSIFTLLIVDNDWDMLCEPNKKIQPIWSCLVIHWNEDCMPYSYENVQKIKRK